MPKKKKQTGKKKRKGKRSGGGSGAGRDDSQVTSTGGAGELMVRDDSGRELQGDDAAARIAGLGVGGRLEISGDMSSSLGRNRLAKDCGGAAGSAEPEPEPEAEGGEGTGQTVWIRDMVKRGRNLREEIVEATVLSRTPESITVSTHGKVMCLRPEQTIWTKPERFGAAK
eukprot:SAG11_NODE_9687_length_890_cov_0.670038_1_plen_170_part_00